MSVKAPRLTGLELLQVLKRHGFEVARVRGSHHFVKHPDGRRTTVPVHGREVIGPGLLSKICRDVQMTIDQLYTAK